MKWYETASLQPRKSAVAHRSKEANEREARKVRQALTVGERYGTDKTNVAHVAGAHPRETLATIDFAEVERRLLSRISTEKGKTK